MHQNTFPNRKKKKKHTHTHCVVRTQQSGIRIPYNFKHSQIMKFWQFLSIETLKKCNIILKIWHVIEAARKIFFSQMFFLHFCKDFFSSRATFLIYNIF